MKKTLKIALVVVGIFIAFLLIGYFKNKSNGIDFLKIGFKPTKKDILAFANEVSIPDSCFFISKREFQKTEFEKGMPNTVVYDNHSKVLYIGTCFEDFPFLLDTFYHRKKILKNPEDNYLPVEFSLQDRLNRIEKLTVEPIIDQNKKYYIFYYFPFYSNQKSKGFLKEMYERYKDSTQFYFVNSDEFNNAE